MRKRKMIIAICTILFLGVIAIIYIPYFNSKVYHLLVNSMLDESVPYIQSNEVNTNTDIILDTRSLEEYSTSHLPNAIWVGENQTGVEGIDKNAKIVVYCSLGKRSELLGELLIKNGYSNVNNLYGGIIDWHNEGMLTVDEKEDSTSSIHPYSWFWGLWVQ